MDDSQKNSTLDWLAYVFQLKTTHQETPMDDIVNTGTFTGSINSDPQLTTPFAESLFAKPSDPLEINAVMEYKILERIGGMTIEQRVEEMNALGAAGWDAFAVVDHCIYFKRIFC